MNKDLLERIKTAIRAEPRAFDMGYWFHVPFDDGCTRISNKAPDQLSEKCGTAACIAGWAYHLDGHLIPNARFIDVWDVATELLQIDEDQEDALFHTCGWPERFADGYDNAESKEEAAEVACARIDHFMETGE